MSRAMMLMAIVGLLGRGGRVAGQVDSTPTRAESVQRYVAMPGLSWDVDSSDHFVVRTLRGVRFPVPRAAMLDSLEVGWTNANRILGTAVSLSERVPVFVIPSPSTVHLPDPAMRGAAQTHKGGEIVFIIHNDSVKPYTRHEVMHVITRAAWGGPASRDNVWMVEALGQLADGVCQGVPNVVAARDIMRWSPIKTAFDFTTRFYQSIKIDRAGTYVLAGSMLEYLWNTKGPDVVRDVWRSRDPVAKAFTTPSTSSLASMSGSLTGSAPPIPVFDDPTPAWRTWVLRTAGDKAGLDSASYRRYGCR